MASQIKLPPTGVPSTGTTGAAAAHKPGRTGSTGTAPALPADRFGAASKLVTQLTGQPGVRAAGQLVSDLGKLVDPEALPGRLVADLGVHLPELVALLALTRQQKATRLVEFVVPYAARLAELAKAVDLPQPQRALLEQKLLNPLAQAGLDRVVEVATGKSGVEVAQQLLSASTPEEARALTQGMTFDAPTWAARPEVAAASEVKRGELPLLAQAQPTLAPVREQRLGGPGQAEEEAAKRDRGDKRLGKNMVWNVMHMFRGDAGGPLDERKQKEVMLATGAIVVLVVTVALVIALALVLAR